MSRLTSSNSARPHGRDDLTSASTGSGWRRCGKGLGNKLAREGKVCFANRSRSMIRRDLLLVFLILIGLVAVLFLLYPDRRYREDLEEKASFAILAKADTAAQLQEAVGDLGILLQVKGD